MKHYLLLLLLSFTFSNLSFGQHSKPRLDRKMERQLQKNDRYFLDLWGTYILSIPSPNCIYKWGRDKSIPISYIRDWVWEGYENPVNVNMLQCKDEKLYNYVRKKFYRKHNKRTIYDKEYYNPLFRIDSIDNKFFLCAYNKNEETKGVTYYRVNEGTKNGMLKGIWQIEDMLISVYGNAVNDYFDVIENIPMPSPLPPHKTIHNSKYGDSIIKLNKNRGLYRNGYAIYKNGKIKGRDYKQKHVYPYDDNSYREYIQNAENKR